MRRSTKITFDTPPTIDQTIEALQKLRDEVGGDAIVRVRGRIEMNVNGPRLAAISVEERD
jgi:hypothetical protein